MTCSRLFGLLAVLGTSVVVFSSSVPAATNLFPPGPRLGSRTNLLGSRTNLLPKLPGVGFKTNAVPALQRTRPNTNANAAASLSVTNRGSGAKETFQRWQASPAFYPALVGVAVCLALLFLARAFRSKPRASQKAAPLPSSKLATRPARSVSGGTINSCNVLEIGPQARQVWQFEARGGSYVLDREQTCLEGESLPAHIVAKDWRSFFHRKLNIAWLPPENVFLRVAQLPRSDFEETLAMVELQLEKLSPMPVAQIAWSIHVLSQSESNLQTVIVMMVERAIVEEYLGRLEGQGFLADRLELPALDQLQATAITEDGAWIYPDAGGGKNTALVAWWYRGVLQSLDLLTMPPTNRPASLKEQLMQMAWSGELEGWLTAPPQWHLVADVAASEWEPALRAGLEEPIETLIPRPTRELAALTARRSAQTEARANLMPVEFVTRYQQQFVDRLWMRGLLALGGLYLLGVAIYMIALGYATYRTDAVEKEVAQLGPTYTNAIQIRDRFKVLKERQELKYAGLDCWSTTARLLRENMTLDSMNFSEGRRLNLDGTSPGDQTDQLYAFEGEMRKATIRGEPLFDPNKGESIQFRVQGATAMWHLSLELTRSEVQ
jgi:hypothetical protein